MGAVWSRGAAVSAEQALISRGAPNEMKTGVDIAQAVASMQALAANGFRYPFPTDVTQQDVRAGIGRTRL